MQSQGRGDEDAVGGDVFIEIPRANCRGVLSDHNAFVAGGRATGRPEKSKGLCTYQWMVWDGGREMTVSSLAERM